MTFQIRQVSDGRVTECQSPILAKDFLTLLGRDRVTLAKVLPVYGEVKRAYRLVTPISELLDLEQYRELYNANRALVALIEPMAD